MKESERQDYRRATNWRLELGADQKFYWTGRKNGYVSEDGKNSHEEDYANNIEYFLYNPDKLKEVTPNAYQWIKNRFGETFKSRSEKK